MARKADLISAGYVEIDSLARYSVWVAEETGTHFVYDLSTSCLHSIAGGDSLIRMLLVLIEGSGDLLGDIVMS